MRTLTWLVLGVGLLITTLFSFHLKNNADKQAFRDFQFASDQIALRIEEKLASYALVLKSAAALFEASDEVTREDWRNFTDKLRASDFVTGIHGIGFSRLIHPDDLQQHLNDIRSEGFSDYKIMPEGSRDTYSSIIFLEPFKGSNLRAFGYDMYSEPVRRAAMEQARDTGKAALTGKVTLVQESGNEVQAGALMYVPVFRRGEPTNTIADRQQALIGWTYSPYRMQDLMLGILGDWETFKNKTIGLRIFDGDQTTPDNLMYSNHENILPTKLPVFEKTLSLNSHLWTIHFQPLGTFASLNYSAVWATFLLGSGLSFLLALLVNNLSLTRSRAESIAKRLTETVRSRDTALRESEFRWRFAIEGSGDGLWDWDLKTNTLFYSRQWKAMLGYDDDEVGPTIDEWEQRIHPEDRANSIKALDDYIAGKASHYAVEQRLRCKDGSWRWFSDRGVIVSRDDSGQPLRLIGTQSDITRTVTMQKEQKELLHRLKTIAGRVPGMVYEYRLYSNGTACFPYASEAIKQIYRVNPADVATDATPVFNILHPDDKDAVIESINDSAANLSPWKLEYRTKFADGTVRWLYGNSLPHLAEDDSISWYGFITDITEQKEISLQLRSALLEAKQFRQAMDYVDSYIYMKDTKSHYTYANKATLELFNCSAEQLRNSQDSQFFPKETVQRLRYIDKQVLAGQASTEEVEVIGDDGHRRVYLELKTPIYDDVDTTKITGLLGISTDITTLKDHERQLEHIAHYDALTNLPNRVLLADRIHQAMMQSRRSQKIMAVVYLDLDGFKSINDHYGHQMGDKFLMAVADRMRGAMRQEDTLSRIGGDEFVGVLLNLDSADQGEPLLERLLEATSGTIFIDEHTLKVSASMGVSYFPQENIDEADQLLRQADQAMYQAKQFGKGRFHIFDSELDRSVRSQHETLSQIRDAIENNQFVLFYQPKVDMRHGTVIGAEALIRWQHPDHGLLSPGHFLPAIENHPLIVQLGDWVMNNALQQMTAWQAEGFNIPISINISAEELRRDNFVQYIKNKLAEYPNIKPENLELEILETSALGDLQKVTKILEGCNALGINISLDDFGTGYSSLTYLKRLPASTIKIDQSFIRDLLHVPEDLAILDGVIELAMAFNRKVIAEGVETLAHGNMLLRVGCDLAQGYGIGKPMPSEDLQNWVNTWKPDPHWENTKRLNRELLPLLYAGVEHNAWVELLNAALFNDQIPLPEMNPQLCQFGHWLNNYSQLKDPQMNNVRQIHSQLHELAQIVSTQRVEQDFAPEESFKYIDQLRKELLVQLDKLIETTSQKTI